MRVVVADDRQIGTIHEPVPVEIKTIAHRCWVEKEVRVIPRCGEVRTIHERVQLRIARLADRVAEVEDVVFKEPRIRVGQHAYLEPFFNGIIGPDERSGRLLVRLDLCRADPDTPSGGCEISDLRSRVGRSTGEPIEEGTTVNIDWNDRKWIHSTKEQKRVELGDVDDQTWQRLTIFADVVGRKVRQVPSRRS